MGRNAAEKIKDARIQIRLTAEDREKLENAWQKLRPRVQFQEFLLELMDRGINEELHHTIRNTEGVSVLPNGESFYVPILPQTVAAGHGQEMIDSMELVGRLPFLKKMLRGLSTESARALEVRGDSMTGIQMFDGDYVVFIPGSIRGDGIYVLRVGDSLIVKRVEFDEVTKKLRIMSENPRYPDRVESADGQTVEVVGKVYGWVHAHPY